MTPERFELKIVYGMNTVTKRWGFSVYRIGAGLVAVREDRRSLLDLLRSMLPAETEKTSIQTTEQAIRHS